MLQFFLYFGGDIDSERNCSKHFTNSIFPYIFCAFNFDLLSSFPVPFPATTCFFEVFYIELHPSCTIPYTSPFLCICYDSKVQCCCRV